MHARWFPVALVTAALLAPVETRAQAAFMSLNSLATGQLPQEQCLTRAKAALSAAGFEFFDATLEAVWGRTTSHRDLVAIYCPASHDIALFAAASPTGLGSVTGPLVDRLVEAWQKLGGGR